MTTGLDLQSRRVWLIGAAVVALLLIAAAWFLMIQPKRSDTAGVRAQTADAQSQNTVLAGKNVALTRQSRHLFSYQDALRRALAVLPAQSELAVFSRSVTEYAAQTGVELTSISVGTPSAATAAVVATTPDTSTDSSTDSGETSSDSGDTTAPTVVASSDTATGPMSTTFTLQVSGTTAQELAFLEAVRSGSRAALITSAQITAGTGNPTLNTEVNVFSSEMPAAQVRQLQRLLQPAK